MFHVACLPAGVALFSSRSRTFETIWRCCYFAARRPRGSQETWVVLVLILLLFYFLQCSSKHFALSNHFICKVYPGSFQFFPQKEISYRFKKVASMVTIPLFVLREDPWAFRNLSTGLIATYVSGSCIGKCLCDIKSSVVYILVKDCIPSRGRPCPGELAQ